MPFKDLLRTYYSLTKPGVLFGNAITAGAGFLLASRGSVNIVLFLWLFLGTTLIIASACVINNVLDQDIDRLMERTKTRAMAAQALPNLHATIFGIVLGLLGFAFLVWQTNMLVVLIGAVGWIDYVWLYGALSKRLSVHGTLVGAISGAMPVLAGYCAVSGRLDLGAVLVFMWLFLWQMPEFYSIAVYRRDEYAAANIPVISVVRGIKRAKIEILVYTGLLLLTSVLLTAFGYTKFLFLIAMIALIGYWLVVGVKNFDIYDDNIWGRKMFRYSLIVLLVFSALISLNAWLI